MIPSQPGTILTAKVHRSLPTAKLKDARLKAAVRATVAQATGKAAVATAVRAVVRTTDDPPATNPLLHRHSLLNSALLDASAAIPGAALTGAVIGAAVGGVTGLLKDRGVDENEATYYEDRIDQGGVFVSVNTADGSLTRQAVDDGLSGSGGHSSSRAKIEPAY